MLIKIDDSALSADRNDIPADSNMAHEAANQDTSEASDEEDEEGTPTSLDSENDDEENSDELDDFEDEMYSQYSDEDMPPPECEVEERNISLENLRNPSYLLRSICKKQATLARDG
jgi:hypothetical protein